VRCFSNCDEVELFLNGASLGKQTMPRNSHLRWSVNYVPGVLAAKGYQQGRVIAEQKVETTGQPAAIRLMADRAVINADGEDLGMVTAAVTDALGRVVPTGNALLTFAVEGAGEIIGVGNGDPICHEPDVPERNPIARSVAVDGWQMRHSRDGKVPREGAGPSGGGDWSEADIRAGVGPLQSGEAAVFQTRLNLTAADLQADDVLLHFGMIDDHGWVYVNGVFVGESHDWRVSPAFEIKEALRVGDNTIVVRVQNGDNVGGLNRGATVEFLNFPPATPWQRSAFNGLAQVIVRAGQHPGEVKLRAQSPGLQDGEIVITLKPAALRPAAPSWPPPGRELSSSAK
jgi:beta-galactosidase